MDLKQSFYICRTPILPSFHTASDFVRIQSFSTPASQIVPECSNCIIEKQQSSLNLAIIETPLCHHACRVTDDSSACFHVRKFMVSLGIKYFINLFNVQYSTQQHKLLVSISGFFKQIILNKEEQFCIANYRFLLFWLEYFTRLLIIYSMGFIFKQNSSLLIYWCNFPHVSYIHQA